MPLTFLNHFSLYEKTRRILETYRGQPFRLYSKLSIIMDNSRATGRFTHRGSTRFSDIDNESDHGSMDSLGQQTPQADSQQPPPESLSSFSHHDGSTSSGPLSTLSLATPHSQLSHSPLNFKPLASGSSISASPSPFLQGYPLPSTTPQIYIPPAYSPQQVPRFFQQGATGGPIRRSVSNPATTSALPFASTPLHTSSNHPSAFNPTMPLTASTSITPLRTSEHQQDSSIHQSALEPPYISENRASNPVQQSALVRQPLSPFTTSSVASSLKRKRVDAAPESSSSKRTSVNKDAPVISSAMVGVTGAMNSLSTRIHESNAQTPTSMIQQAGQILNATTYLSPREKTKLYRYFCKESQDASALPDMDDDFRQDFFNTLLSEL